MTAVEAVGRVLLLLFAGVFFGLGWLVAVLWAVATFAAAAVRAGWVEARPAAERGGG